MKKLILPRSAKRESQEELPKDSEKVYRANIALKDAGKTLEPLGSKYIGSATIHYYVKSIMGNEHQYQVITQTLMGDVPEGFADYGHKEMQKSLMRVYGRERKERT